VRPPIIRARGSGARKVLLGITGSWQTFPMANVVERVQEATLGHGAQQDAGNSLYGRVHGAVPTHAINYTGRLCMGEIMKDGSYYQRPS